MKKLLLISLVSLILFFVSYQVLDHFTELENITPGASLITITLLVVTTLIGFKKFILVRMEMLSAILAMTAVLYAGLSVGLAGCFKTDLISPLIPIFFFIFTVAATLLCVGFSFYHAFCSLEKFYHSKIKKILISTGFLVIIWGGIAVRVFIF